MDVNGRNMTYQKRNQHRLGIVHMLSVMHRYRDRGTTHVGFQLIWPL